MSREFPDFVDPWKAADGRRVFQGTMPLKRMQRLGPELAAEGAAMGDGAVAWHDARFSARFSHDRQGLVTIRLEVEAELPLICQRSLSPYLENVRRQSLLVVIEDVSEQEALPESYEPFLVENRRMALLDIVEEELLLAIPPVPKNPEVGAIEWSADDEVEIPPAAVEEKTHRPFAGLAGLMKTESED